MVVDLSPLNLAQGNLSNAAQLTANQTAQGLASLVPFMIPGGQVLGPAILGTSAAGSAFEEDLHREGATMSQIYNASYLKGGVEFGTELVTAGIIGKAKKALGGGMSEQAVREFTKDSWKKVLGDTFSEGISEGLADTGSRIVDSVVFGDDFDGRDATIGFLDSAIVGAIVGGKVSTFGQIGANSTGEALGAKVLETPELSDANEASAKKIEDAIQTREKILNETEGSLLDQVTLQQLDESIENEVAEVKERTEKHVKALKDMTKPELIEYAKNLDNQRKVKQEIEKIEKADEAAAES